MSDNTSISRRTFTAGLALVGLGRKDVLAQGFAGLGMSGEGFAPVTPGKIFSFPEDNGPHPDFRIVWWNVTANLADSTGGAHGRHGILFRQAIPLGAQRARWASQQIRMGHAIVPPPHNHR